MKKWFLLTLLCCLMVLGQGHAWAQETIPVTTQHTYLNFISTAAVHDTYYALNQAETGYELFACSSPWESMEGIPVPEDMAAPYDTVFLTTDGEHLVLVSLTQGQAYTLSVLPEQQEVQGQPLIRWENSRDFFDVDEFGERYLLSPSDAVICENQLVLLFKRYHRGEEQCTVYGISLADGQVQLLPLQDVTALASCDEQGFFFLQKERKEQLRLMYYDMPRQKSTTIHEQLGIVDEISQIRYSTACQMVVYMQGQRMMGVDREGNVAKIGYTDSSYLDKLEVVGNQAICLTGSKISRIPLETSQQEAPSLTLYGWGDVTKAVEQMKQQVEGFELYRINAFNEDTAENLMNRIVTRDQQADLYIMNVDTVFLQMKRKGYCANLSDREAIVSAAEALHPIIRNAVSSDGAVCALPLNLYAWGWDVGTSVMEDMGLTQEELPQTMEELCAFITRWNNEWVLEYPDYSPVEDWTNLRERLLHDILDAYLRACHAKGQRVDFLSEDFTRLMDALGQMRCDKIDRLLSDGEYRKGLFHDSRVMVGNFSAASQKDDRQYWPMTLLPGDEPIMQTGLEVLFVNPAGENIPLAKQFVEAVLATQDEVHRHSVYTTCVAPVENPDDEKERDELTKAIEAAQAEMETAAPDRQIYLREELKWLQGNLEQLDPYLISAEAIAFYQQEVVPGLWLPAEAAQDVEWFLNAEAVQQCVAQYLDGYLDGEKLAQRLDGIQRMMEMEGR